MSVGNISTPNLHFQDTKMFILVFNHMLVRFLIAKVNSHKGQVCATMSEHTLERSPTLAITAGGHSQPKATR